MKSSQRTHETLKSRENGQGVLEYSVIIGLVLLIIISFIALFGVDLFNQFINNRARANEEAATQVTPEALVEINETGVLVEAFDTEIIRIENCPVVDSYNPRVERDQWLEYEVVLGNQISAALRAQALARVQSMYGFTQGARETRTLTLNLEAPPDTIVDYTIDWQYVWNEGNILVTQPDGSSQSYPYRTKTNLEYEIMNITQSACEATPAPYGPGGPPGG